MIHLKLPQVQANPLDKCDQTVTHVEIEDHTNHSEDSILSCRGKHHKQLIAPSIKEKVNEKMGIKQFIYEYSLLLWDGFAFFGFDDTKLGRIKGAKVTFTEKFKSKRWMTFTFSGMIVILIVLISEIKNLGQ